MKILAVHNYYQLPGGEDTAYEREVALLRQHGHQVITYERSNQEVQQMGLLAKAGIPARMTWSVQAARQIREIVQQERPQLAHFHNTHFMISPAAYYACAAEGVPVVQSLDNPRLICPAASLYRQGRVCQDCMNKTLAWPGILHACYRDSRSQTAAVATMLTSHKLLKTWKRRVAAFFVATQFYRDMFIEAGLAADKLLIKPHFVSPDPQIRSPGQGDYALFIGRLDPEKGIATLLRAWEHLPEIPLSVRGSGPLLPQVQLAAADNPNIQLVERLSEAELIELIKGARFLVWPSEGFYETFGFVAAEALACGVPVLASSHGVMAEMIQDGVNGLHVQPGNAKDLANKVRWAWENPAHMATLGLKARRVYEERYAPDKNYELLMEAYATVLAKSSAG
ncbi:MAG: glycosyltransferase family 4 protein [Anaerolineales bacterium]|nr:glycosyltransferase family 4 protein [Anaerolineales bacterium]MCW5855077.1 glycosyltransferase family 4 protein [Anaerolineales bacterium]